MAIISITSAACDGCCECTDCVERYGEGYSDQWPSDCATWYNQWVDTEGAGSCECYKCFDCDCSKFNHDGIEYSSDYPSCASGGQVDYKYDSATGCSCYGCITCNCQTDYDTVAQSCSSDQYVEGYQDESGCWCYRCTNCCPDGYSSTSPETCPDGQHVDSSSSNNCGIPCYRCTDQYCEDWSESTYTGNTSPCGAEVHFTKTFTNPLGETAIVTITGSADDGVLYNGSRIGDAVGNCMEGYPGGPWGCKCGFSGYTGTIAAGESFTLSIIDNVAGGCSCNLRVCYSLPG